MVENQIDTLILNLSFGHNLCFKYSNGTWKLILDIYVPRAFQWYKELFNPMNFDPWNHSLKIWKSIETPIPKVGAHLEVCGCIPSHLSTFSKAWNVTFELYFLCTSLQALALVVSPKLRLWHFLVLPKKPSTKQCACSSFSNF